MAPRTLGVDPEALENRDRARERAKRRNHRWSGPLDCSETDKVTRHCLRPGCPWLIRAVLVDRNRSMDDDGLVAVTQLSRGDGVWREMKRPPCEGGA
jgi:hypothetical protein